MEVGTARTLTRHLLWAATQGEVVRHVLQRVGADAAAIAAQIEEEADVKERTDSAPSLSPDAKAALLAAYEESRQIGASYVEPEHVLLALAQDSETEAGELARAVRGQSHEAARCGHPRGVPRAARWVGVRRARRGARRVRPRPHGGGSPGKLDPVISRADQD